MKIKKFFYSGLIILSLIGFPSIVKSDSTMYTSSKTFVCTDSGIFNSLELVVSNGTDEQYTNMVQSLIKTGSCIFADDNKEVDIVERSQKNKSVVAIKQKGHVDCFWTYYVLLKRCKECQTILDEMNQKKGKEEFKSIDKSKKKIGA